MSITPGIYQHYKGQLYQVFGLSRHSETEEQMVVYRCLYGDYSLWVRPLSMFDETVRTKGGHIKRFSYLPEAALKGSEPPLPWEITK